MEEEEAKFWNEIQSLVPSVAFKMSNNLIRKQCYRVASGIIDGYMGRQKRKQLPKCVINGIRNEFPNEDGRAYMGFHSAPTAEADETNN